MTPAGRGPIIGGVPAPTDPDVSPLLSVRHAVDLLDAEPVSPRIVRLPLSKCRGLRLAKEVSADRDYPPFDKALMDGYAVRAADVRPDTVTAAAPAELPVVGEVPAGMPAPGPIGQGEAMAVMTGAPVPPGTEAVVPVEQTSEVHDGGAAGGGFVEARGRVRVTKGVPPGYAIARRGSDCPAGQVVLPAGTLLEAPALAVAASVGAAELDVYARPRVAVLGTGDELVPVGTTPADWQIRNSNNVMLVALLDRLGCDVTDLGVVTDDPDAIRAAVAGGLAHDALFVTGGMSMGNYDYVPAALIDLGVDLKITKVRLKPGKPFVFGRASGQSSVVSSEGGGDDSSGGTPFGASSEGGAGGGELRGGTSTTDHGRLTTDCFVFGLPGNPVSAFVCTVRLAARVLARLAGGPPSDRWLTGRLAAGLPANGPREFYQPVIRTQPVGHTSAQNELPAVEVLAWKGSADVFTLARANGLLVRAENEPALPKGTMVRVMEI
ncbi:MAG: moeA [Phycisphaerales bacterium]|nr:moeA [Phycisphaerales bacterium]